MSTRSRNHGIVWFAIKTVAICRNSSELEIAEWGGLRDKQLHALNMAVRRKLRNCLVFAIKAVASCGNGGERKIVSGLREKIR